MNTAALVGYTSPAGRKAYQHCGMEWEGVLNENYGELMASGGELVFFL